jgi:hypothetical protein
LRLISDKIEILGKHVRGLKSVDETCKGGQRGAMKTEGGSTGTGAEPPGSNAAARTLAGTCSSACRRGTSAPDRGHRAGGKDGCAGHEAV